MGDEPLVLHNDDPRILELAQSGSLDRVVISPGPGHPSHAGLCLKFLHVLNKNVPVLGVCLGHQILGLYAGSHVEVGPVVMHGMESDITHCGTGLFRGLPNPLHVGRYHSLVVVEKKDAPNSLFRVTARGPLGEIMGLQYNDRPWAGVQFHPESVLTPEGMSLLSHFPTALLHDAPPSSLNELQVDQEPRTIKDIMEYLGNRQDLTASMAQSGFDMLMDGRMTPAQAGAFLMGLRAKGESPLELAYAVRAALARAIHVKSVPEDSIDIVGTGGDGRNSFNCSTAAALTLAGMGYHVVKHGNRAVSSTSGTADALESLGITLEKNPDNVLASLHKTNFGFFFAPYCHPAFKNIGPLRRELCIRTLFNLLGPMINPARPPYLLMGVARPEMVQLVADTLVQSPLKRACVVYGAGGYDEVTPMGPAQVLLLDHGTIEPLELDPLRFDIGPCKVEDLTVSSKEEAGAVLKALLQGRGPQHMQDMVILNAGLAIFILEPNLSLAACMAKARESVQSGAGRKFIHVA